MNVTCTSPYCGAVRGGHWPVGSQELRGWMAGWPAWALTARGRQPLRFTLTKWSRRPGTGRDSRYWTQSALPTHTGADDERAVRASRPPGSGAPSGAPGRVSQRVHRAPGRRTRNEIVGSARPRQRRPTRLKRSGACSGLDTTWPDAAAATAGGANSKSTAVGSPARAPAGQAIRAARAEMMSARFTEGSEHARSRAVAGLGDSLQTLGLQGNNRYGPCSGAWSR